MIFLFHRVENTVEKGENAGDQHFLLFPVFSKASFLNPLADDKIWSKLTKIADIFKWEICAIYCRKHCEKGRNGF